MSDNPPNITPLKDALVSQRVAPALKERLRAIFRRHRVSEAALVRDALEAICVYVELSGGYRTPIKITFDHEASDLLKQLVAEPGAAPLTTVEANSRAKGQVRLETAAAQAKSRKAAGTKHT